MSISATTQLQNIVEGKTPNLPVIARLLIKGEKIANHALIEMVAYLKSQGYSAEEINTAIIEIDAMLEDGLLNQTTLDYLQTHPELLEGKNGST